MLRTAKPILALINKNFDLKVEEDMELKVYNSLTRRDEEFKPLHGKDVKMFVCGQTVYDDAHLGHAKTYVQFDIIVRWLRKLGFNVFYVQNITDVEDKIISRAKESGVDPLELSRKYAERYLEDLLSKNFLPAR